MRLVILFLIISTILPELVWAEGESDPLWKKPTYEKKVYAVGKRILEKNGITEKIVFQINHDRNKVNASARDDINVIEVEQGLLNFIESDDELAAVLSHEIAHVTLDHVKHQNKGIIARNVLITGPLAVVGAVGGVGGVVLGTALGNSINHRITNSGSRKDESEADKVGFGYLVQSEYEPEAFISLGKKIFSDGNLKKAWRTHPMGTERLAAIEVLIADYKAQQQTAQIITKPTNKEDDIVQISQDETKESADTNQTAPPLPLQIENDATPTDILGDD